MYMKKLILLITTITIYVNAQTYLVSATEIEDFDIPETETYLAANGVPVGIVEITNGVKAYKIVYNTVSYDSSATTATGVVFVPQNVGTCPKPILSYDHGTMMRKTDAPSYQTGEYVIGIVFSGTGYIVTMPDYLGLGDGPGFHPYHHAHSEATATVDMIRAAKEFMDANSIAYSDQLFLTGYSQGGHASMATHKLIQTTSLNSIMPVTASAPLSGAYDMANVQAEVITRDSVYDAPGYLPFIIFGLNMVYNMYSDYSDIFRAPYNTVLPPIMNGSNSLGYVESFIPDTPNAILRTDMLNDFETNPNHIFRNVLRENSLYNWVPTAPVMLGYCTGDNLVTFRNAIVCRDSMIARGATSVIAVDVNTAAQHQDCALYALLGANFFFDTLRTDIVNVSYTSIPSTSGTGSIDLTVSGGTAPYTYTWSNSATTQDINGLNNGLYTVTVTDDVGCSQILNINLGAIGIEENNDLLVEIMPNPSHDKVMIKMNQWNTATNVEIIDLNGKMHLSTQKQTSESSIEVDITNLVNGIYFVKVIQNNTTKVIKLIKN